MTVQAPGAHLGAVDDLRLDGDPFERTAAGPAPETVPGVFMRIDREVLPGRRAVHRMTPADLVAAPHTVGDGADVRDREPEPVGDRPATAGAGAGCLHQIHRLPRPSTLLQHETVLLDDRFKRLLDILPSEHREGLPESPRYRVKDRAFPCAIRVLPVDQSMFAPGENF